MALKTLAKGTGVVVLSLGFLAGCSDEGSMAGQDGEYYIEDALNTWAEEEGFINETDLNTLAEENGLME